MKLLKNVAIALSLTLSLLPALRANAQESSDEPKFNIIKWNPFSLALNTFSLSYERRVSQKLTIEGTLDITASTNNNGNSLFNLNSAYYGTSHANAYGFVIDLKYFATNQTMPAPTGFFVGPFVRYQAMSFNDDSTAAAGTRVTIGGNIGYQVIAWNVVSLEIFGGPAYEIVSGSFSKQASGYGYNYPYTGTEPLTLNALLSRYDPFISTTGSFIGFRCGFTVGIAF